MIIPFTLFFVHNQTRFSTPRIIVENFLNPLFILFVFGIAMNQFFGLVDYGDIKIPYLVYFLSGSVNIALITNCSVAATRLFLDKYIGTLDYYISYPIGHSSILSGRLLFHIILSLVQVVAMSIFVKIIYPQYILFSWRFLSFACLSILCSVGWFSLLNYLCLIIKTQDGFNVLYYLIMTPVLYLSSIYYPVSQFPTPLRIISLLNPLTWSTDVSRVLIFEATDEYFVLKVLLIIVFALVSYTFITRKLSVWTKQ